MSIRNYKLERINDRRRRRGQLPLSRRQAVAAIERSADNDTSGTDFLFGLFGVPWPSIAGVVGYAIHENVINSTAAHADPASITGGVGNDDSGSSD